MSLKKDCSSPPTIGGDWGSMENIKFRAWDKVKKYMVYDNDREWMPESYPVWVSHRGIVYCKRLEFKPGDGNFEYDAYHWENVEIMQWTGYVDKAGQDIYEGDILRCQFDDVMKPVNMVVKWEGVGWNPFNSYSDIFKEGYKPSEHLVIGNIYANPEIEYKKPVIDTELSEHDQELIKEGKAMSDFDTRRGI